MLFFTEMGSYLSKIRSQLTGLTLNLKGSLKEFSDVEEILKQEISEFEVSLYRSFLFIILLDVPVVAFC